MEKEYNIPWNAHTCKEMPYGEFIEKEDTYWHIHRTDMPHSHYRVDLKDNICPYCGCDLSKKEQ